MLLFFNTSVVYLRVSAAVALAVCLDVSSDKIKPLLMGALVCDIMPFGWFWFESICLCFCLITSRLVLEMWAFLFGPPLGIYWGALLIHTSHFSSGLCWVQLPSCPGLEFENQKETYLEWAWTWTELWCSVRVSTINNNKQFSIHLIWWSFMKILPWLSWRSSLMVFYSRALVKESFLEKYYGRFL